MAIGINLGRCSVCWDDHHPGREYDHELSTEPSKPNPVYKAREDYVAREFTLLGLPVPGTLISMDSWGGSALEFDYGKFVSSSVLATLQLEVDGFAWTLQFHFNFPKDGRNLPSDPGVPDAVSVRICTPDEQQEWAAAQNCSSLTACLYRATVSLGQRTEAYEKVVRSAKSLAKVISHT